MLVKGDYNDVSFLKVQRKLVQIEGQNVLGEMFLIRIDIMFEYIE